MREAIRGGSLAVMGCLCLLFASAAAQEGTGAWQRHMDAAQRAYRQGNHAEIERLLLNALKEAEKFTPQDPRLAVNLNALGEIYSTQGKYKAAEPYFTRALALREQALGQNHVLVAATLHNLAGVYKNQERYADAEPLYMRALAIREKALGAGHQHVALTLNDLAHLMELQAKYVEAEPLYWRALAILEKEHGEPPELAAALSNLARFYEERGRYADAELLYKRSLAIVEKTLGAEHPYAAHNLNNLAEVFQSQGKYAEADPSTGAPSRSTRKSSGPRTPSSPAPWVTTPFCCARPTAAPRPPDWKPAPKPSSASKARIGRPSNQGLRKTGAGALERR